MAREEYVLVGYAKKEAKSFRSFALVSIIALLVFGIVSTIVAALSGVDLFVASTEGLLIPIIVGAVLGVAVAVGLDVYLRSCVKDVPNSVHIIVSSMILIPIFSISMVMSIVDLHTLSGGEYIYSLVSIIFTVVWMALFSALFVGAYELYLKPTRMACDIRKKGRRISDKPIDCKMLDGNIACTFSD